MSNTAIATNKSEDKTQEDELEEILSRIRIEDIPLPKKELEKFEIEVREVMKSGCNLQIAEYSLLKCNITSELEALKENYNEYKNKIKNKMEDDIKLYFNCKHNGNQKYYNEEKLNYEEEASEIMDEYKK